MDVSSLNFLRSIALPIEAILAKPLGTYSVPVDCVPDMSAYVGYHIDNEEECDEEMDDSKLEEELFAKHKAGQGLKSPTIPLAQLLPPGLRYLRVFDDWALWVDTIRLDKELRDLMTDPQFIELRCIRVRRQRPLTRHVKIVGWREEMDARNWHVLRSV